MFFKKMSALLIIASFIFCGEAFARRTHLSDMDKEASRSRTIKRKSTRAPKQRRRDALQNRRQSRALSRKPRIANVAQKQTPTRVRARRTTGKTPSTLSKRAATRKRRSPVPVEPRTAAAKHNSANKTYNLSANDIITGLPAAARPNAIEYFRQDGIEGAALHQKEKISHANLVKEINEIEELAKVNPELLGIAEVLREHLRKNFGFQG